MRICLIVLISLVSFSGHAEIYKTKDKNGRIVYTDQPPANDTKAEIVNLPSINELPPVEPMRVEDEQPPEAEIAYNLEILAPTPNTRLQANERDLNVSITADQGLKAGHFYVYFLNGERVKESTEQTTTISEPPRGENALHVEVIDNAGRSFGRSKPVLFSVFRPIVKR